MSRYMANRLQKALQKAFEMEHAAGAVQDTWEDAMYNALFGKKYGYTMILRASDADLYSKECGMALPALQEYMKTFHCGIEVDDSIPENKSAWEIRLLQ